MKPIQARIDVTKIIKEHLYEGAKGTYLDITIWPNRDGVGQFGSTHSIKQSIGKAARDAGQKEPYIGDAKFPTEEQPAPAKPTTAASALDEDSGDLPF